MTQVQKVTMMMMEFEEKKFFGELLLKYEAGKIVVIKKTESVKI